MPHVHYTDPTGIVHDVDGAVGISVMVLAVRNGVPGIIAECGGSLNCASCHVYVSEEWVELTGRAEGDEEAMLEGALADQLPGSRLSCQVVLGPELDGLQVTVPAEQI